MENRIEEYTVGELARASGVSVRMLHHYDAIGLLKPAHVASNGYRIYRRSEALRLQEILFYRATGMQLRDIAALMNSENPLQRLMQHREKLIQAMAEQAGMVATLDRTIAHLQGDDPMTIKELYKPFSAKQQAEYEEWLIETYGEDMAMAIAKSHDHQKTLPDSNINAQNEKLMDIEAQLVAAYETGSDPQDADLAAHQNWVGEMWGQACKADAYAKLSEMYLAHPDFIARYERLSRGFSQWLTTAMQAWSKRS